MDVEPQLPSSSPVGTVIDFDTGYGVSWGGDGSRWIMIPDDVLRDPSFDPTLAIVIADELEAVYARDNQDSALEYELRSKLDRPKRPDRQCAVYRFFDVNGRLLYVGKGLNPEERKKSHQRRIWWPDVESETVEWYESEQAALDSEDRAIRDENPLYNRMTSMKR